MVNNDNLDKTEKHLREVAKLCIDGVIGYKDASQGVDNDKLKILFGNFSKERKEMFERLNIEIMSLGGQPINGDKSFGTLRGSVHDLWFNVKEKLVDNKFDNIIKTCEQGEKSVLKRIEQILEDRDEMTVDSVNVIEGAYNVIIKRLEMLNQANDFYYKNNN